jgi:prepilin-type N-terminal cleavage/methylation domain-containing protein
MIFKLQNSKYKQTKGFTLVELIVSLGIFSISMLVATGAVFTIVNSNKKAHSLKSVVTNLNFALEGMTRDVRVGTDYVCTGSSDTGYGNDCPFNGGTGIQYTSNKDRDGIGGNDLIDCTVSSAGCDVSGPVQMTSPDIYIRNVTFRVLGTGSTDSEQPRILVNISGYVTTTGVRTDFNIQTTITQRVRNG